MCVGGRLHFKQKAKEASRGRRRVSIGAREGTEACSYLGKELQVEGTAGARAQRVDGAWGV